MDEDKNHQNTLPEPTFSEALNTVEAEDVQATTTPPSPPEPTPQPTTHVNQNVGRKPPKYRFFFFVLSFLQALGVVVFLFMMFGAQRAAKAGVSGTEFIGLFLLFELLPAIGIVALVNLIGLGIYLLKVKPRGIVHMLSVISITISAVLFFFAAYSFYQYYVVAPRENEQFSQTEQAFAKDNANPEITEEAHGTTPAVSVT